MKEIQEMIDTLDKESVIIVYSYILMGSDPRSFHCCGHFTQNPKGPFVKKFREKMDFTF